MSKRGLDFVQQWIEENVHPDVYVNEEGPDSRPKELAEQCLMEAQANGISRKEIEDEVGPLDSHMVDAINSAADAEVDRLASKDD